MKVEEVFKRELLSISDPNIQAFVMECFDALCPEYFWTCAASSSGKYHPKLSLGEGGLVRHTKLAVWWGMHFIEALDFIAGHKSKLKSEVTAALLMHDMVKCGFDEKFDSTTPKNITASHGTLLAEEINIKKLGLYVEEASRNRIIVGVAGHMGKWTSNWGCRPANIPDEKLKEFAQLVHLADYCASRKVDAEIERILGE